MAWWGDDHSMRGERTEGCGHEAERLAAVARAEEDPCLPLGRVVLQIAATLFIQIRRATVEVGCPDGLARSPRW